jgi:hypothetical protein
MTITTIKELFMKRSACLVGLGTSLMALLYLFPSQSSGAWVNVTGNLAGMSSECGNMQAISAIPNANKVIAVVSAAGLWATTNGGTSWAKMGGASGNAITNRGSQFIYDPSNPNTFWECGIYHNPGIVKTTDGGASFIALGGIYHNDGMAVDLSDPLRKTILAGAHETKQKLYKSIDGGNSFTDIGASLPAGSGFSSFPALVDAQTYIMTATAGWGGGSNGVFRSTNAGTSWTTVSSEGASSPACQTSKGDIYFGRNGGGLLTGNPTGTTWTVISNGATGSPIELPGGKLAVLVAGGVAISADDGATWTTAIHSLPNSAMSLTYNSMGGAFYVCHWDCGNAVLSDAVWRYDTMLQAGLNVYALQPSPASITNDKANTIAFSVHASNSAGSISTVTIDLTSLGGGAAVAMTKGAGDLYTCSFDVAAGIAAGTKNVVATATDNTSAQKTLTAAVVVTLPAGPSHYQYLYVDTSTIQASIGWYGNGAGSGTAATGCAAAEISTGAYEGTKCLDFTFAVNAWWAGFGLVWNSYNYVLDATGYDSLVFWFKADAGVSLKVTLDGPTVPVNGLSKNIGGTGAWARAALSLADFAAGGYDITKIKGVNFNVNGNGANTPSGHVYTYNVFVVGSGTSSVVPLTGRFAQHSSFPSSLSPNAPVYDMAGRIVGRSPAAHGHSATGSRLYLVKMADGNVVKRLAK